MCLCTELCPLFEYILLCSTVWVDNLRYSANRVSLVTTLLSLKFIIGIPKSYLPNKKKRHAVIFSMKEGRLKYRVKQKLKKKKKMVIGGNPSKTFLAFLEGPCICSKICH